MKGYTEMALAIDNPTEKWVTIGEAAKQLRISRPTLWRIMHVAHVQTKQHPLDKRLVYVDVNYIRRLRQR